MRVNDVYAVNAVCIGGGAEISVDMQNSKLRKLGLFNRSLPYILPILKNILFSRALKTSYNINIDGMSELMMRCDTSPETRKHAINIRNASKSLLTIINDILDFSKIEAGKNGNIKYINGHLAELLATYTAFAETLACYAEKKETAITHNNTMDAKEIDTVFLSIKECAVNFDIDGIMDGITKLKSAGLSEMLKIKLEQIADAADLLEYEKISEIL